MSDARKLADLKRDGRFALHGPTVHPEVGRESDWPGEAKIAGRVVSDESTSSNDGGASDGEAFIADIVEVVISGLNADATKLVVESWTPDHGLRIFERS